MKFTRRNFIKTGAVAAGAAAALPLSALASAQSQNHAAGLALTIAGYNLDRTRALFDGRVKVDGCAAEFREAGIGDLNTHVFSGPRTLDVTEIGLHPFMLAWANEDFRAYVEGHPQITRLFPDYRSVEQAYYTKTGIFPIMHAVAVKREFAKAHPWVVQTVFNAYSKAKQLAYQYLGKALWFDNMLPWAAQEFEETRALMGQNFYSYGIEPNRNILEKIFRYSYEQQLCKRELNVEEIFEPSSLRLTESFT